MKRQNTEGRWHNNFKMYEKGLGKAAAKVVGLTLRVALFPIAWWFHWKGSKEALESVGLWNSFQAAQLDRCIWNYQTDSSCRADLDCRHVPCPTFLRRSRESTIFSTASFVVFAIECIKRVCCRRTILMARVSNSHAICLGCKGIIPFMPGLMCQPFWGPSASQAYTRTGQREGMWQVAIQASWWESAPTAGKVRNSSKMETVFFSLFDLFLKQTSSVVSPQALRKDLPSCTKPTWSLQASSREPSSAADHFQATTYWRRAALGTWRPGIQLRAGCYNSPLKVSLFGNC